ncbi:hypothetical protein FJY70_00225 [candidate division WOR-3 bacterium]|nr:hypothetical protein [candidate division WOR-3 bacterium]
MPPLAAIIDWQLERLSPKAYFRGMRVPSVELKFTLRTDWLPGDTDATVVAGRFARPPREIRAKLSRLGWRWGRRRHVWWTWARPDKRGDARISYAYELAKLGWTIPIDSEPLTVKPVRTRKRPEKWHVVNGKRVYCQSASTETLGADTVAPAPGV